MTSLGNFRTETRDWLEENCPASMRTRMVAGEDVGGKKLPIGYVDGETARIFFV